VLGAVFSGNGGHATGASFVSGMSSAVWVGGAAVAVAAAAALALPRLRTPQRKSEPDLSPGDIVPELVGVR